MRSEKWGEGVECRRIREEAKNSIPYSTLGWFGRRSRGKEARKGTKEDPEAEKRGRGEGRRGKKERKNRRRKKGGPYLDPNCQGVPWLPYI